MASLINFLKCLGEETIQVISRQTNKQESLQFAETCEIKTMERALPSTALYHAVVF